MRSQESVSEERKEGRKRTEGEDGMMTGTMRSFYHKPKEEKERENAVRLYMNEV